MLVLEFVYTPSQDVNVEISSWLNNICTWYVYIVQRKFTNFIKCKQGGTWVHKGASIITLATRKDLKRHDIWQHEYMPIDW
jgi:hypothetical protein